MKGGPAFAGSNSYREPLGNKYRQSSVATFPGRSTIGLNEEDFRKKIINEPAFISMIKKKQDEDDYHKGRVTPDVLASAFYLKPLVIKRSDSNITPDPLATSKLVRPEFLARDTYGVLLEVAGIEVLPEDQPDPGIIERHLDNVYTKYQKQVKLYKDLRGNLVESLEGIHSKITSSSTATNNMASLMYQMIDNADPSNTIIENRPDVFFKAQYFSVMDYNMFEDMINEKFTSLKESTDPEHEKSWNSLIYNLKARKTNASWALESAKALEDFLHYVMQSPNVENLSIGAEASENSSWDRILFKLRFIVYCFFKTQGASLLNYKINKKRSNDLLLLWKGFKDCHIEDESNFHYKKAEKIYHPGYIEAIKKHLMLMPEFLLITMIKKSEVL